MSGLAIQLLQIALALCGSPSLDRAYSEERYDRLQVLVEVVENPRDAASPAKLHVQVFNASRSEVRIAAIEREPPFWVLVWNGDGELVSGVGPAEKATDGLPNEGERNREIVFSPRGSKEWFLPLGGDGADLGRNLVGRFELQVLLPVVTRTEDRYKAHVLKSPRISGVLGPSR